MRASIVVDLTDVEAAPAVLSLAVGLAVTHHADIEAVSCIRPYAATLDPFSVAWAAGMEEEALEGARTLQDRLLRDALGPAAAQYVVAHHVVVGDRVAALTRVAHRAHLLVVAHDRRSRRWRPSLAERCARRVPCPVIELPGCAGVAPGRGWRTRGVLGTTA